MSGLLRFSSVLSRILRSLHSERYMKMADENQENGNDASGEQKSEAVRQAVIRAKERQFKAKEDGGAQEDDAPASQSIEADDSTVRDRESGTRVRKRRRCCRGAGGGRGMGQGAGRARCCGRGSRVF
jgi:hypothetical protein